MSSQPEPQDFIAVVFVIDTSVALGSQWLHVLSSYISPLFRRLIELNPNRTIRIGIVVYTLPDMTTYSPIIHKKFLGDFTQIADILKKDAHKIGLGSTLSGDKTGMPALEGVVAAIEMLDALTISSPSTSPGRPITLNIFHITAVVPDKTTSPQWNELDSLDHITWETLPSELLTRKIHLSSVILNSDTSIYTKLHASGSTPAWFQTRPSHTILLPSYFSTALPQALKRPADTPVADKAPAQKRPRLPGVPSSSPLVANSTSTPPNHNNNNNNGNNARPGFSTQPPGVPGRPPLTHQQLQGLQGLQELQAAVQRLRVMEERMQNLEAGIKDALQAGDTKKADELGAELTKIRTQVVQAKGWIQQQFKQTQLAIQANQLSSQQSAAAATNGGPSANVPPNGVPPSQGGDAGGSRPPSGPNLNLNNGNPVMHSSSPPPPLAQPQNPNFPQAVAVPNSNQMGGAAIAQGLNAQGLPRMPVMSDLATQMHKLVEQNERSGRPQSGPGGGSIGGMPGAPPGMLVPHQNSGQPGIPGQNPASMLNGMGGPPSLKPPGAAAAQQSQVPVWQGPMVWQPEAMNGMRELSAHIAVLANSPNGRSSHSDTWPKTIYLSASQPTNPLDVQAWFKQHQQTMFFGKLTPGPDVHTRESYSHLWTILMTKKIYLLGAWTTPSGSQTKNLLIAAAPNSGLLGAFFPHDGLPELPKSNGVAAPPTQSQPPMMGVGGTGGPQGATGLLAPDVITGIRSVTNENQRALAAHQILVKLQQTHLAARRTINPTDLHMLLSALNVSLPQLHAAQRQYQQRALAAQGQAPQLLQPQQPGMPGFGGGGGGSVGGPLGMNMGGVAGGGGIFPMFTAQNTMNVQRGNLGGMSLGSGQQMMNGGGFPGRQGMGGGPTGGGMQGNVSMEMMQSFAQRNVDGGMGQGPG
ncbi:hypothetical protein E1B28_011307 [Marasmius oreades]|uniref:Uncharacterized protein n=1 Tax=Marasmius oreades TaxID=181124 RepID=A0A9P7UQ26_9AGAR|nr:uncharacterized protein E1B28_011307 [Marasmius oreades]KAG7089645.1 hypothetical protein E1B28_011307 [Marasmius oreades]